jgi:hypothetical protein
MHVRWWKEFWMHPCPDYAQTALSYKSHTFYTVCVFAFAVAAELIRQAAMRNGQRYDFIYSSHNF